VLDLSWTKWQWDRVLSEYFGFHLSVSFYKCSILYYHLHLHVALTKKTNELRLGNKTQSSCGNRGILDREVLSLNL